MGFIGRGIIIPGGIPGFIIRLGARGIANGIFPWEKGKGQGGRDKGKIFAI